MKPIFVFLFYRTRGPGFGGRCLSAQECPSQYVPTEVPIPTLYALGTYTAEKLYTHRANHLIILLLHFTANVPTRKPPSRSLLIYRGLRYALMRVVIGAPAYLTT